MTNVYYVYCKTCSVATLQCSDVYHKATPRYARRRRAREWREEEEEHDDDDVELDDVQYVKSSGR